MGAEQFFDCLAKNSILAASPCKEVRTLVSWQRQGVVENGK
jgi:hypothetical protein